MITQIKHPSRAKVLVMTVLISVLAHAVVLLAIRIAPIVGIAMGLSDIEYVEEEYNRAILIDFSNSKRLKYPPGYIGFRPPEKTRSLDDVKKEEERLRRLEARRKRERELAEKRAAEELAKAEEKARAEKQAEDIAKADPKPTPTPVPGGYGRFGKINTRPIKDQIQRLYQAKKDGKLAIPDGKFKVGVSGSVNPDGTLADYRVHVRSGIQEIDDSAMAILAAVSESRALGPLSQLTSITMVLDIDQNAQLIVTGFARSEDDASDLVSVARAALLAAWFKKSNDPAAMIMLKNIRINHKGPRIEAVISVPKETAKETLAKMMDK
jgi:hypothetical protein